MKQTDKMRLKIASKFLKIYIERGEKNVDKYTTLSIKIADELINKINNTSENIEDVCEIDETKTYFDQAREHLDILMLAENNDDAQTMILGELLNHVEFSKRGEYLRFLNTLFLNQLLNNSTKIGLEGEKKCINFRKLIVNKFIQIYA